MSSPNGQDVQYLRQVYIHDLPIVSHYCYIVVMGISKDYICYNKWNKLPTTKSQEVSIRNEKSSSP